MATSRQQFCGDTVNIFGHQDQKFQWSRAYFYYSSHSAHNEVIWTYGIARAGCVPEVFDCKEMVSWCTEKYIPSQRIIPLRDNSPISFSPKVFCIASTTHPSEKAPQKSSNGGGDKNPPRIKIDSSKKFHRRRREKKMQAGR
jgi:hypothetical protein